MNANVVGIIIGAILTVATILLVFLGRKREVERIQALRTSAAAVTDSQKMASSIPQDLTIIEGIGPKISRLLRKNGITTFAQLAGTDLPVLEKLLKENGMQFVKADSWAEQARLAGAGKLEELKVLQEKLVAGR